MSEPIIMTDDDRAKFDRGCEMLKHLQAGKGFDDHWVPVGEGLLAVRRTVMAALSLRRVRGSGSGFYNDAFGRICARTPYAEMKKVDRSNLLYCMENLPSILEMRANWTPSERAKVNHPTTMRNRLKEFLNRAPTDQAPRRNASPMALLKDRNEQLTRTTLDQAERIASLERESGSGSLFDLHQSSAEEIATAIVGELGTRRGGPSKAKAIAEAVLAKLAQRPSRAAG